MIRGQKLRINFSPKNQGFTLMGEIFTLFVYPDLYPEFYSSKQKTLGADSDFIPTNDGGYYCVFSAEETQKFKVGSYTLEIKDPDGEAVFRKVNCFSVEDSAHNI